MVHDVAEDRTMVQGVCAHPVHATCTATYRQIASHIPLHVSTHTLKYRRTIMSLHPPASRYELRHMHTPRIHNLHTHTYSPCVANNPHTNIPYTPATRHPPCIPHTTHEPCERPAHHLDCSFAAFVEPRRLRGLCRCRIKFGFVVLQHLILRVQE